MYIEKDLYRMSERFVTKGKCYGSKKRFDKVMIENNESNYEMTGRNMIPIEFKKCMVFIRIGLDRIE